MAMLKNLYNRVIYGITPEMLKQLHEAEKRPIVYDDDVPELTDKELTEFKPLRGYAKKAECKEEINIMLERVTPNS
jgi:hypothetical protein